MMNQALNFIDEKVIGSSLIYEAGTSTVSHITESKTYPYTVKKSIDGGATYSDVLFYGNKFLQAGATNTTLELTDFVRFSVYTPSYQELKALTTRDYQNTGVISRVKWDVYDGTILSANRIAGNEATVASIFRYPNRKEALELMVADPGITQSQFTSFSSLLQGAEMISPITRGVLPNISGYKLLPRFPRYIDTATKVYAYFGIQVSKTTENIELISVNPTNSQIYNWGTLSNIPTGVSSGVFAFSGTYGGTNYTQMALRRAGESFYQVVAQIDTTPCAKYYLLWQDRFGGYQSQPFCKGNTFSESFETSEVKNYANERKIVLVDIQPKWELNTGWIDEELYPIYESIFTSKILVITDTEEGVCYEVILKDKEYTEKTFKNQGRKLFNIKLTLERTNKQQITY